MSTKDERLKKAIDRIVNKYQHVDWRSIGQQRNKAKTARRETARRRAASIRAASVVLDELIADGARLGPQTTVMTRRPGESILESVRGDLENVARALDREAVLEAPAARRPRDHETTWLVGQVALVCQAHDVRFTDSDNGAAARILLDVFQRVNRGAISTSALRPYLRIGRQFQDENAKRS